MGILDELTEKFAINLDLTLVSNPEYNKVYLHLQELYEKKFSKEQTSELDALIGKLSLVIFNSAAKAGMKLGAKIAAELLK